MRFDIRTQYAIIHEFERMPCIGEETRRKRDEYVTGLKREVRAYNNRERDRRCIHEDDYGYYTMLIEFPDFIQSREEAEDWFDYHERRVYVPSPYDCTGQHMTRWYKLAYRRGRWYCYHGIAVDI